MTVTVYIDQDCKTLGPDATADDLETYRSRLEAHLEEHFGRDVTVRTQLGGQVAGSKCPADEEIDEYVRDLEAGDGWLELMGAPGSGW